MLFSACQVHWLLSLHCKRALALTCSSVTLAEICHSPGTQRREAQEGQGRREQPEKEQRGAVHHSAGPARYAALAAPATLQRAESGLRTAPSTVSAALLTACVAAQCGICRSTFVCTSSKAKLQEHVDGKHPKAKFEVRRCLCGGASASNTALAGWGLLCPAPASADTSVNFATRR